MDHWTEHVRSFGQTGHALSQQPDQPAVVWEGPLLGSTGSDLVW